MELAENAYERLCGRTHVTKLIGRILFLYRFNLLFY